MAGRRVAVTLRPSRRGAVLLVVACVWLAAVPFGSFAQEGPGAQAASQPADDEVTVLLDRAREALAEARDAPGPRHPDAAAWERALDAAHEARAAARDTPSEAEAVSHLAQVYGDVRWWSRAYAAWSEVAELAGGLDPDQRGARREAAAQVAFARYGAGDLEGAERRFRTMLEHDPEDAEALSWIGRIALETGRPAEAADAFERLLGLRPEDAGARYHLELARERATHGPEASDAHRRGIAAYEQGALDQALAAFEEARAAAPGWLEPTWWRARVLLESGRAEQATGAWRDIVAAWPGNADAAWFLERARLESRVGRDAATAADEARAARAEGDVTAALDAWSRAVDAAPDWVLARARQARAALEAGETATARAAFRGVLERAPAGDPLRAEARAGLERVDLQERLGPEVGTAYGEALDAYERGDMDAAEREFLRVTRLAPEVVDAWGWLGRLAFARSDWARAAEAYERAAELAPGDDDYAFFAEEARRLAGSPSDQDHEEPEDEP